MTHAYYRKFRAAYRYLTGQANLDARYEEVARTLSSVSARLDDLTRLTRELVNAISIPLAGNRIFTRTRMGHSMFIDDRDTTSGLNIISYGVIEPEVIRLMQKFLKPGQVFLDVGANFGFFSFMAARHVGPMGKVYAFEANPHLIGYIDRTSIVNGTTEIVRIINKAVSDGEGMARFGFTYTEIGGGSLSRGSGHDGRDEIIDVPTVRIDDAIPREAVVCCAKLDVEGAELAALRGMVDVVARSPDIKLILEHFPTILSSTSGRSSIVDQLALMGLGYWRVTSDGHLEDVTREQLVDGPDAYIVAARTKPDDRTLVLETGALRIVGTARADGALTAAKGGVLLHGPYWYLLPGTYEVMIDGRVDGILHMSITHEAGVVLASGFVSNDNRCLRFSLPNDVRYFEVVLRAQSEEAALHFDGIRLIEL